MPYIQESGSRRVACDTIALGATKNAGWWQLPDIGTQVLLAFVGKGHSNPVVMGNIYDLKHRPPKHSTEKKSDSIVYQTKGHRLEF
ncbi:MAG: phage baseplate assembly protein V, partial [Treponema sp.]|nr:phage baseplate assembly protein V [Treponema sp.]